MKLILYILVALVGNTVSAQQSKFLGTWEGKVSVGVELRIVFNIKTDDTGNVFTTMDSPDQSAFGLPTDYTHIRNDSFYTAIEKMRVYVSGKLTSDSTINGVMTQTIDIPLQLKKVSKVSVTVRSQTPVAPFPYNSEDVSYQSVNGIKISGTVTSPRKDPEMEYIQAPVYPAVLLISGSGPQNRDEEVLGHKPFAVIADHLTKKGFIVLRYDDRGTAGSTGDFNTSTSRDFADDAEAGINYLKKRKDVDLSKIGIIGHSEGGMIAPMIASKRNDIDFLILLAGPGIKPIDLMTEQNLAIFNSAGMAKKSQAAYGDLYNSIARAIVNAKDSADAMSKGNKIMMKWLKGKDNEVLNELGLVTIEQQKNYVLNMSDALAGAWFKYFLTYDPAPVMKKVTAKVLAINGEKDIQVLPKSNLAGMKAGFNKAESLEIHEIKGVNHLFQNCKTCTLIEYGNLDETFSPVVLDLMYDWLRREVLGK